MKDFLRLTSVLVVLSQSVGCVLMVPRESKHLSADQFRSSRDSHQSNDPYSTFGLVNANQTCQRVIFAEEISPEALETEPVVSQSEARRQRDLVFAQAEKQAKSFLAQRQIASLALPEQPITETQSQVNLKLPSDVDMASKLESQGPNSINRFPTQVNFPAATNRVHQPILLATLVALVLSGVTWPLTRKQKRIAHQPQSGLNTQSISEHPIPTTEMALIPMPVHLPSAGLKLLLPSPKHLSPEHSTSARQFALLPSPVRPSALLSQPVTQLTVSLPTEAAFSRSLIEFHPKAPQSNQVIIHGQTYPLSLIRLRDARAHTCEIRANPCEIIVHEADEHQILSPQEHPFRQLPVQAGRSLGNCKRDVGYVVLLSDNDGPRSVQRVLAIDSYSLDQENRLCVELGREIELS